MGAVATVARAVVRPNAQLLLVGKLRKERRRPQRAKAERGKKRIGTLKNVAKQNKQCVKPALEHLEKIRRRDALRQLSAIRQHDVVRHRSEARQHSEPRQHSVMLHHGVARQHNVIRRHNADAHQAPTRLKDRPRAVRLHVVRPHGIRELRLEGHREKRTSVALSLRKSAS